MKADPIVSIHFGQGGNDRHHLGAGWSGDEPGFRWAIGGASELWLEHPGSATDFVLELAASPFVNTPGIPAQRLRVRVRDHLLGEATLTKPTTLGFHIPASILDGPGPVRLELEHPDAARPVDFGHANDVRPLAISFRSLSLTRISGDSGPVRREPHSRIATTDIGRLTGAPAVHFMQRFESLGDNCEFGLVQRRCGAEPLGLLRFSNLELHQLLRGLENRFEGLGDPARMEALLSNGTRREWIIRDRDFALVFHTFLYEGDIERSELVEKQAARLTFLRRKLLEDLATAEKIFVCKRNAPLTEQEILPLHAALNRFGRSTLLWVVPGDEQHPPGAVDRILPGLLRGYINRFAPNENAHDFSLETWLSICVNAAALRS